jgi:polar amino acid transport system substrate-binding protein
LQSTIKERKDMKKIISIMLVIAILAVGFVALAACNDKESVKVIDIKLTEEDYAFAVNKADSELLAQINAILDKIMSDGTMDAIMEKYFAGDPNAVEGIVSATPDASKNQLIVATNAEFPPFEFKIGNKFAGIDMEIAKIIADELGKELVIDDMEFGAVINSVNAGICDVGMAGLTVTDERKQSVNFSASYFMASQMIITKAGDTTFNECTTAAEVEAVMKSLTGKKVGYQNDTTGQLYITGDEDWGFDGFPNLTAVGYSNGAMAVQDMLNGNIDFVVIDEMPAKFLVKSYNK